MFHARPTTRTHLYRLILGVGLAIGFSHTVNGQELAEFVDDSSLSAIVAGSPLDRLPNLLGDFFQSTSQLTTTFRPEAMAPTPALLGGSTVVLDAANNRFVYIDVSDQLLVPGNIQLGTEFVFFRAVGGGLLTQTTNTEGVTGFFGLERVSINSTTGAQTVTSSIDIITGTGTQTVTDPVSMATFSATPQSARLSIISSTTTEPTLGNAGLLKMSAGGSPIPRDRVFFNYNYFESVPLATTSSVNQFIPGFEKTFLGGLMSVEAKFPFAATLDTDFNVNGTANSRTGELGDISVALKSVLSRGDNWLLSGGLQLLLPTADDMRYLVTDGTTVGEFLRIENKAVHVMPFLGASFVTDSGIFLQSFLQIDADANGMPVLMNTSPFSQTTMTQVGRLNAATMMYLDLSVGYWLVQEPADSAATLTAVMPLFEFHVNRSLSSSDSAAFQPLGSVGRETDFQLLNTTFGMVFEFQHDTTVSAGYSTSIQSGNDGDFGGEFRLQVSHRFGAR